MARDTERREEEDSEPELTLCGLLRTLAVPSEHGVRAEDITVAFSDPVEREELLQTLYDALAALDKPDPRHPNAQAYLRHRKVLMFRYGIPEQPDGGWEEGKSLKEVGEHFGVGRERAKHLETEALLRLRKWYREHPELIPHGYMGTKTKSSKTGALVSHPLEERIAVKPTFPTPITQEPEQAILEKPKGYFRELLETVKDYFANMFSR